VFFGERCQSDAITIRFQRQGSKGGRPIDLFTEEHEISKIFDRQALEGMLDPTNYVGNSGAMVDGVLNGRKG
jgi:adenylosuccinate lyase